MEIILYHTVYILCMAISGLCFLLLFVRVCVYRIGLVQCFMFFYVFINDAWCLCRHLILAFLYSRQME
ncbi:hypothetical protein BDZ91DRAFT_710659 [Kalaharituber pfeilii]|nr:hypothetical protein BDZ91DRAFT_710659 [Kalaharituber pfeilii]